MLDLILVHRRRNGNPLQFPVPIWRTCLREIGFFDFRQFDNFKKNISPDDEVFHGENALTFLVEVICGLHSPVLGETEVQGQFKDFLASENQDSPLPTEFKNFTQDLFRIVKLIRSEHLSQLGCHSYGSWVRQQTRKSNHIGIMGSGHLTGEILPWLKKKSGVHLMVRNTDRGFQLKSQYPNVIVHSILDLPPLDCLIVAAPLENSFLTNQISNFKTLESVFDFRGESDLNGKLSIPYCSLQNIMSDLQLNKKSRESAILKSKESLSQILHQHIRKANFRPGGWEDLCG
jgi:glutamyl-tRNA reductase